MTTFTNPYLDMPTTRVQVYLGTEDYEFLKRLRIKPGTGTTTINLLVHKLCTALREANVQTTNDFEAYVAQAKVQKV